MRITTRKAVIGSALLVLLLFLFVFTRGKRGEGNAPPTTDPAEARGTVVTVEKIVPQDIIEYSEARGSPGLAGSRYQFRGIREGASNLC
jgi:hypothetical protein